MIDHIHKQTESLGAFVTGFLLSLIIFLVKEISSDPFNIFFGILLIFVAVFVAKKTAHHFHDEHTHVGDSTFDIVAIAILFLVNIFHPAVDGFSFYEISFREGIVAGSIFGLGIIFHEVVRQSVLVTVFKNMGIRWYWVVSTAVLGIALGVATGFLSSNFLEQYEWIIDLTTLFAYSFIVSEFYFSGHFISKKSRMGFLAIGILVGVIVSLIS